MSSKHTSTKSAHKKSDAKKPSYKSFSNFGLSPLLLETIKEAGFIKASDVQLETIPAVLEGKDVLARAETGSGKTAAFVLPLLQKLIKGNRQSNNNVGIVVLVPTRELTIQIREEFERFSAGFSTEAAITTGVKPIKCLSVYGGVKINPQMIALRGGADVLVSTPGRLLDLAKQNAIRLHQVKTLVVDEVDRLMKGDFQEEIEEIFKLMPKSRQNLMFTATFPDSIRKLVRNIMDEPEIINVDETLSKDFGLQADDITIDQRAITVNRDQKNDLLAHLLKENNWKQVLVFCSAKRTCDNLVIKLEKRGIEASAMHGNQQQNARAAALRDFKAGKIRVLIATDVAGRGVDIEQLPCVINYELPRSPNDYTHRIGRTGRAGEAGIALSLISHHEYQHFGVIEKRNGIRLEREQVEGFEPDKEAPPEPVRSKPKKIKKKTRPKKKAKSSGVDKSKTSSKKNKITDSKPDSTKDKTDNKENPVNAHIWGSGK
ncbi:ATP-dependent RNA helicase RhlE [Nymphon striatum]|nr:ATP-dependent RNA helicase RhlE [Nymphon striatum]